LETAHPVKFPEAVEMSIGLPVAIPAAVKDIMELEKKSIKISSQYIQLKDFLLQ